MQPTYSLLYKKSADFIKKSADNMQGYKLQVWI